MSATPSLDRLGVRLHAADNVVVATRDLRAGETGDGVSVRGDVPRGHKVAITAIGEGEPVRKYNQIIGFATTSIEPGDHVHTRNVAFKAFERDYAFGADVVETPVLPESERATFQPPAAARR